MKDFTYFQPTEIRFGTGRIREVGEEVARWGRRCLLVTVPVFPEFGHACQDPFLQTVHAAQKRGLAQMLVGDEGDLHVLDLRVADPDRRQCAGPPRDLTARGLDGGRRQVEFAQAQGGDRGDRQDNGARARVEDQAPVRPQAGGPDEDRIDQIMETLAGRRNRGLAQVRAPQVGAAQVGRFPE